MKWKTIWRVTYRDIVVTNVAETRENASPSIGPPFRRISRHSKNRQGTGKRAVRYRQDARIAASQSDPQYVLDNAHYRVSESLPAETGLF